SENAVSFANDTVNVRAAWDRTHIVVTIVDDGPGFQPELLARIGEPYVTTSDVRSEREGASGGLGLGVFIAKTLLERTGARLYFENDSAEGHARVRIVWPREAIEA